MSLVNMGSFMGRLKNAFGEITVENDSIVNFLNSQPRQQMALKKIFSFY